MSQELKDKLVKSLIDQIEGNADDLLADLISSNGETVKYSLAVAAVNQGVIHWDIDSKITITNARKLEGATYQYDPAQPELPKLEDAP